MGRVHGRAAEALTARRIDRWKIGMNATIVHERQADLLQTIRTQGGSRGLPGVLNAGQAQHGENPDDRYGDQQFEESERTTPLKEDLRCHWL